MPHASPRVPSQLPLIVCLVALWAVTAPAFSADTIYLYVDDEGTSHYTNRQESIPDKYRRLAQPVDPETGKPFKPESVKTAPAPPPTTSPSFIVRKESAEPSAPKNPPFYAPWLEKFSKMSIPLPSQVQFASGILALVLIFGAIKIMRLSSNPAVKLLLKCVILGVLVASAYMMYASKLSSLVSEKDSTSQSISGQEVINKVEGVSDRALNALIKKTTAPLERVKDATVEGVNRAVREKENAVNKSDSAP